jgi:hypothetical protein
MAIYVGLFMHLRLFFIKKLTRLLRLRLAMTGFWEIYRLAMTGAMRFRNDKILGDLSVRDRVTGDLSMRARVMGDYIAIN